MGQAGGTNEKTRLCPTCRMEISVLATKCRYCGESVGRPRDETRSLSIDDLGGETIRHYAPSSSVMEAMEAFRSEHEFKSNPPEDLQTPRKSMFGMGGKKKMDSTPPDTGQGLPQLDERSQALASLAMPSPRQTTGYRKPKGPSVTERLVQAGGIVVGIIVLVVVVYFAYGYFTKQAPEPTRTLRNPAEEILARNGDPMQAVIEARKTLSQENHSKNRDILTQAQKKFKEKIHGLLNASPWSQQTLRDAARNVNEVFKVDSSDEIRKLKEEVDGETFAYQMSLLSIGADNTEVTFGLSTSGSSGERTAKAKVGDTVGGRFKVVAIKRDRAQVEDQMRGKRLLTFNLNDPAITSP